MRTVGSFFGRFLIWYTSISVGVVAALRMSSVLPYSNHGHGSYRGLAVAWIVASAIALCVRALLDAAARRPVSRIVRQHSAG